MFFQGPFAELQAIINQVSLSCVMLAGDECCWRKSRQDDKGATVDKVLGMVSWSKWHLSRDQNVSREQHFPLRAKEHVPNISEDYAGAQQGWSTVNRTQVMSKWGGKEGQGSGHIEPGRPEQGSLILL